jgi:hypothetical protein
LVQGICGVVEDPLSGFLKAKNVRCKCIIRNKKKENFGKYMILLLLKEKVGLTT